MARTAVVAIPVRDEAERIEPCLLALNAQTQLPDGVVLMLNNCRDDTETIVRAMAPRLRFRLDVVCRDLAPHQANAGHARGLAMKMAAEQAGDDGALLTTDADATVPPDWISRNLVALCLGADVVCGQAVIDPVEAAMIPAHLHADDAQECKLIALLDELAWVLDPEVHDPPPRHTEASGASLAARVGAFRRVGGIPDIRSGEDRAFVRALWMLDAQIRHDPAIRVVVSGRIVGRAEGGMADAIRRRMVQQDEFVDDQVEPATDAFRRYGLRYRVRRAWRGLEDLGPVNSALAGVALADAALAGALAISWGQLGRCLAHHTFGSAWAALESRSPILRRRRVRFADVAMEIAAAEALLHEVTVPESLAAD